MLPGVQQWQKGLTWGFRRISQTCLWPHSHYICPFSCLWLKHTEKRLIIVLNAKQDKKACCGAAYVSSSLSSTYMGANVPGMTLTQACVEGTQTCLFFQTSFPTLFLAQLALPLSPAGRLPHLFLFTSTYSEPPQQGIQWQHSVAVAADFAEVFLWSW